MNSESILEYANNDWGILNCPTKIELFWLKYLKPSIFYQKCCESPSWSFYVASFYLKRIYLILTINYIKFNDYKINDY